VFSQVIGVLAAVLVAAAVGFTVVAVGRMISGGANRAILASMPRYSSLEARTNGLSRGTAKTPADGSLFLRIAQLVTRGRYLIWLQDKLAEAGLRGQIALSAQLVKKVTYAVVGAILGFAFLTRGLELGVPFILILTVVGFLVPDLMIVSQGQKRVEATELALPDAIDLLNLCVESGLSFENAIARVSVSLDGPVAEEFGGLIADIQLGKSRIEALSQLAERTKSKGLKQFVGSLLHVDRLGVPISGVLSEQASEMRAIRKDRAREQGQKVTIKILMPLMFCFLPAMFMIVLGPAIVQLVKTMSLL
jgi:tight adherence protein C